MARTKVTVQAMIAVILAAAALSAIWPKEAGCQPLEKFVEEITEPQPMPIGTVFFTKTTPGPGYQAKYTYMGFEGNNMKIKYELFYHYDELEETDTFTLPLGANRQSLLATRPFTGETAAAVTKLLITVVDDLSRIKVQKQK